MHGPLSEFIKKEVQKEIKMNGPLSEYIKNEVKNVIRICLENGRINEAAKVKLKAKLMDRFNLSQEELSELGLDANESEMGTETTEQGRRKTERKL